MTGDRIVVDFAALNQASTDISNALTTMRGQLEEADTTAKPLVASWEGGAREAYEVRQAKWTSAANEIATMLGEIQKAVIDSRTGCDAGIVAVLARVRDRQGEGPKFFALPAVRHDIVLGSRFVECGGAGGQIP